MHWAAIVFGWPGALTSIVVSAVGLLIRRGFLVWVGACVGLPFMFYMFLTPRFWWLAAIAASCHFGAALAASRRSMLLGWLLFLPTPLVTWHIAAVISASTR
jgi:hypothetical protein